MPHELVDASLLRVTQVPQPSTGILTFLFTDIEGSTARWDTQREAMAAALVRHDALLREAIEGRRSARPGRASPARDGHRAGCGRYPR